MLNCWRHDPHRRPKFDRVHNSITTEAETLFSAKPALPQLKETPLEQARTDHVVSGSGARVEQSATSGSMPMISRQAHGAPPAYDSSAFLEAGPGVPQLSHAFTSSDKSARLQIPRVDSAPTHPVKFFSRKDLLGTGSDKEPPAPLATGSPTGATTGDELAEMGAFLGRSASFQVPGTPQDPLQQRRQYVRTNSEDSVMQKAKALSRGGQQVRDEAQARAEAEPAAGTGDERESRAREGRQRDAGRVRPKKNRNVQVVHGFRLTAPAEDGEEA